MQNKYKKEAYAGFCVRLAAYALDLLVVQLGLAFIRIPVWSAKLFMGDFFLFRPILFRYDVFDILCYGISVAYFVAMTYWNKGTLGKMLFRLQVVPTAGEKLTLFQVIFRESIGRYLSGILLAVGYLWAIVDRRHQGVHDKLADTYVVYRDLAPMEEPVQQGEGVNDGRI